MLQEGEEEGQDEEEESDAVREVQRNFSPNTQHGWECGKIIQ